MKLRILLWLTAGVVTLTQSIATEASAQAMDWTNGWSGQVTVYGWLPSVSGAQEAPDGEPIVNLNTSDVLSALNFAFMGAGEVRKDKVGLLFDLIYADLGLDGNGRFPNRPNAIKTNVDTKLMLATGAVSYRVYDNNRSFVDAYAGVRAFNVDLSFSASNDRFDFNKDANLNWVDGIVGVRGAYPLSERWSVSGFADVGGFNAASDLSWEVYGGANYAFNDSWAGTVGYRYMSILYQATDRAKLDIDIQGPVFGVTYKF